jgi:glycosyltransferase involved in cell wall biosynthesis
MRILLIGEYSHLHNSLKEGLLKLGHEVVIAANSDGFKKYPVNYDFEAKWINRKLFNIPIKTISHFFKINLIELEYGIRFFLLLPKLKNFEIVQFINETSIKTSKRLELFSIKKILKNNDKIFVLSCGIDYSTLKFYTENKTYKSILQPFFQNPKLYKEFNPFYDYFKKGHVKIHNYIMQNFNGLIATDFDYVEATKNHPIFSGHIPYPINLDKLEFKELYIEDKIIIFLGVNKYSYNQKGIPYFEKALTIIKEKYGDKIEIIATNTIPYPVYIELYNKAHILLDQTFSRDQGYNALEAMAKGKVVFTGAEIEFIEHYKITDRVCINALPDVNYLVDELSFLIENPKEIISISKRARAFIEKEHNYIKIAEKYLEVWKNN